MNKFKLFCLGIILLLTGCTAEYNVTISKDLKVEENVVVLGDDRFKITGSYTIDSIYNALINNYSDIYNIVKNNNINKYSDSGNLSASSEKSYNNLNDYVLSDYIKVLYSDGLSLKENGSVITIASDNLMDNFWLFLDDMDSDPLITELKINIKLPFVVTDHNADDVDEDSNTYTWVYNQNNASKQISIEFDKDRLFTENNILLIILKYGLFFLIIGVIVYFGYKILINNGNKNNKI